ncbi:MAG TPA: hypothetical protein VH120_01440 [Gemmataceae bacterium]|jgi:hypothetical protein|nr:hypothetical protein [Gemmataceae bacterium]
MGRNCFCPDCGSNARWVGMTIECRYPSRQRCLIRTETYFCPLCEQFWDIPVAEPTKTRVGLAPVAFSRERARIPQSLSA